ncbi:MAG: flagellar protein FliT [Ammonifex sp.]|nr:MAG: flagellar protein FliT [Ammonifex sp.]
MEDKSGRQELYTLLGRWLKLTEAQKKVVQQRAPVEALQDVIAAQEELKKEIALLPPDFAGSEDGCAALLKKIQEEEKETRDLLEGWLSEVREEITHLHQGQAVVRAYLKQETAPAARFFDKRR